MAAGLSHAHARRPDSAGKTFRPWLNFPVTALRRKLLGAIACGCGRASCSLRKRAADSAKVPQPRSDRLVDLINAEEDDDCEFLRNAEEALLELQIAVRGLQDRGDLHRSSAAGEIRRLARDDPEARTAFAMLGAIPPLVALLDPGNASDLLIAALYALLNLGIGNDANKAAIVEAGAVHRMLDLIDAGDAVAEAIAANFLSLSALDSNKHLIGSSGAIPFLIRSFEISAGQPRQDALRALLNLSISAANAQILVDAGIVPALLSAVGDAKYSDRILAILSNIASASPECRRAVARTPGALPALTDALYWADSPGCQETAAYVLMLIAHKSPSDRTAMAEAGVASALLELTLTGSTLAQKRAARVLETLRVDKGKQAMSAEKPAISAPIPMEEAAGWRRGSCGIGGVCEEKRAVKQLVQQSLQSNMRRITTRASLPVSFVPSPTAPTAAENSVISSSTSKSLPF